MGSKLIPFYKPFDVVFVRGEGVYLYDTCGKRYLDFGSGVAASSLGHCHKALVDALETQGKALWHLSNVYRISHAERLAEKLVSFSFADMAFFGNSGAEAVECGLKIARSYQNGIGRPERYKILTLRQSFHGRTWAACSANEPTGFLSLLYPYVDWFVSVRQDINCIRDEIDKGSIGTVLLEPVQGEGGINALDGNMLRELRALCDKHNILLFFDCVQCGSGRTGKFFAYEHFDVVPDICTLAKGLGAGFPVGACLITEKAGRFATFRMHGSTCGGNPLATTVAYTVLNEILKDGFLEDVRRNGDYLIGRLTALSKQFPCIEDVRGIGLMVGVQMSSKFDARNICEQLLHRGLLLIPASGNVIRIMPPLIVSQAEIDEALEMFKSYLGELS